MDFLKWYKNKVESNDQEPPEFIWENIQDELDIERSWHSIKDHLNKERSLKRQYYFAIASGILLLFMTGGYLFYKPQFKTREFQKITEIVAEAETQILNNKSGSIENDTKPGKLKIVTNSNQTNNQKDKIKTQNGDSIKETIYKQENHKTEIYDYEAGNVNKDYIAKLENKDIQLNASIDKYIITPEFKEYELTENDKKERTAFRKLYLGSTGQLANTWLLNEKTINGLDENDLMKSGASFGSNWGFFIGTNITKRIDLQFDLNVLAQNNQDYSEYFEGLIVNNKMSFRYSQVALSFRYYHNSKRFMKGEHGVNLGGYSGYLHNATQTTEREYDNSTIELAITGNYANYDYGLFLGYEYIIPISKKLGFGTGVRAYYGLQNIYSGNGNIPGNMNKTNNASLNITFSLKYRIK